jgi:hypothetical protein
MYYDINPGARWARFLDQHPRTATPPRPTRPAPGVPAPYRGYQNIRTRGDWGTSNYNALQVQLIRRYIHGLQFSAAYTYQRSLGSRTRIPATWSAPSTVTRRPWLYAPLPRATTRRSS